MTAPSPPPPPEVPPEVPPEMPAQRASQRPSDMPTNLPPDMPADLTPRLYTQRNRTRRVVQRWSVAAALCALVALVSIALEQSRAPDASAARARERLLLAENRVEQSKAELKSVQRLLKVHERELRAERHLTERPDWSAVLTIVAGQFDRRLVMTGFRLGAAEDSQIRSALGPIGADVPPDSVWLIVTGVAESNSDVSGLILRIEQLGLFDRVVMTGTQREAFAGEQRIGFTLACRVH